MAIGSPNVLLSSSQIGSTFTNISKILCNLTRSISWLCFRLKINLFRSSLIQVIEYLNANTQLMRQSMIILVASLSERSNPSVKRSGSGLNSCIIYSMKHKDTKNSRVTTMLLMYKYLHLLSNLEVFRSRCWIFFSIRKISLKALTLEVLLRFIQKWINMQNKKLEIICKTRNILAVLEYDIQWYLPGCIRTFNNPKRRATFTAKNLIKLEVLNFLEFWIVRTPRARNVFTWNLRVCSTNIADEMDVASTFRFNNG